MVDNIHSLLNLVGLSAGGFLISNRHQVGAWSKQAMAWFLVQPEKHQVSEDTLSRSHHTLEGIYESLAQYEKWRNVVLWVWRASVVLGLVLAIGASQPIPTGPEGHWVGLVAFCFVVPSSLGYFMQNWYKRYVQHIFIHAVSEQFGLKFEPGGEKLLILQICRTLKLVPNFDIPDTDFTLEGALNGRNIMLGQTVLTRLSRVGNRNREVKVFSGVIMQMTLRTPVPAFVYLCPDRRIERNTLVGALPHDAQRCSLEDPRFEKAFEVFTNDQIGARTILTPLYLEKFMRLKELWPHSVIHSALWDNTMMLSFNRMTLFPPKPITLSFYDPSRIAEVIEGFDALVELVEAVTPHQRGAEPDARTQARPFSPWKQAANPLKWAS